MTAPASGVDEAGGVATRRIGITGASGHIGRRVAELLAAQGRAGDLRLIVRDPARAPHVPGAEVAVASFDDGDACRAAFAGLDTLLLVSAGESDDRVTQHRTAIAAATEAGVRHLVYTSFTGASADAEFTLARDHGATEDAIREAAGRSGLTWTFLRDDFYLDVLLPWAGEDRTLRGPAGDGRCAFVAREDVAQVAARVLTDPQAWGDTVLEITGGEALTLGEAAERLTAATGERFEYVDETMAEARASRAPYGAPDWQVDAWISTYTAIASGVLAPVSGDVQQVLGRPQLRLEDVFGRA
ncbi:SDR family oxidoreductase [Brachybacterium halotolerans subsp. kimchii]|uniref:SDR family oxidoreductase n=1 Tax=Brachybacterium halotolerans TaxID=2795215 RepID=UPI001E3C4BBA|nr:SDR family oxidoreductase [Brachybacterium halotolerans]UEJ84457.1 SDR family oxidoreductase [Brachybacterium halotolerans subsp. kimchii]